MSTSSYHHGAVRSATLAAARALLDRMPASEISVRELARAAGVSHAAPYRHFGDRDGFLLALTALCHEEFVEAQIEALQTAPVGDRLLAVGQAYVDFAVDHRYAFQLVYSPRGRLDADDDPTLARAIERHVDLLEQAVADATADGQLPADFIDGDVAPALWSLVHGLAHLVSSGFVPRDRVRAVLSSLLS